MTWLKIPSVNIAAGNAVVSVNGGTDISTILPGWALHHAGHVYEITAKTSTTITLAADDLPGSTASNAVVKIQPTGEAIKEEMAKATSAVNEVGANFLARLGIEETIITSTGTVQFTASDGVVHEIPGWGNLDSAILAKLQSEGAWVDSNVEYGTNANGQYWKYPDGSLIVQAQNSIGNAVFASGPLFVSGETVYPFPISFVGPVTLTGSLDGGETVWLSVRVLSVNTYASRAVASASTTIARSSNIMAIGRWK